MGVSEGFTGAIGNTPLIRLRRMSEETGCEILGKAEFMNPGGSVKDRAAKWIVLDAEARGVLRPGGTVVEGTAGNTGIGIAHVCNARGYRCVIVMPDNQAAEKYQIIEALGAELRKVPAVPYSNPNQYQKVAGRLADELPGAVWANQFDNVANRRAHFESTGPEIWEQTQGRVTHFVSAMGTTGTITGVSQFLKEKNPAIRIIGAQPSEGSRIPGIRKWAPEYLPKIYDATRVDELIYVSQSDAEHTVRRMAKEEGIFAGVSAAGALWVAQQIAATVTNATIVFIVCDRGDRYLSTGVFPA